jgi:hypothetical protein
MRKAGRPAKQFCEDAKGVLALSWCPLGGEDVLLACTGSNKIVLLNVKKGEVRNLLFVYLFSTGRWFHILSSLIS